MCVGPIASSVGQAGNWYQSKTSNLSGWQKAGIALGTAADPLTLMGLDHQLGKRQRADAEAKEKTNKEAAAARARQTTVFDEIDKDAEMMRRAQAKAAGFNPYLK